jgi:murein L,D-transpeptidase YafK
MKRISFIALILLHALVMVAQNQSDAPMGKTDLRLLSQYKSVADSLQKQFDRKQLAFPPKAIYLRSFKYDKQLEVWVQDDSAQTFKHFKTYKVCMQSGSTGPKRMEGDYQVPEGFYHINDFNPNSSFHLSLGVNYPNESDRVLSDSVRPGNGIYIHGNCVSTGCIAIGDQQMEEVYVLATLARSQNQDFIPIHIFPVRYAVKTSMDYLNNAMRDDEPLQRFNQNIRKVYDYFEAKKTLPIIAVNEKGEYLFY